MKKLFKKRNRKRKISNLLLRNYIFLYFLMTFIFVVFFTLFVYTINKSMMSTDKAHTLASTVMKDDYKNIDSSKILEANGFVKVIDNTNLKVVYSKGESPFNKEKYTKKEYHDLLLSNKDYWEDKTEYILSFSYNKNKNFLLVVGVPGDKVETLFKHKSRFKLDFLLNSILFFYLLTLILGILIYSRLTSKHFVTPLKIILRGVKRLTKGDYSTEISLTSQNEFGELKDAFNYMAMKIKEEISLKEKSEKNRRQLIMDISHDLKNPLASIIGYSNLLIKTPDISASERNKYLSIIENNSIRANDMIKDLFEFSRLESTDFSISLKEEDICEFLRELIAIYIPQMEEKNICYDFDIPEESITIPFDKKNLDRAISNLILNSIKYNPLGTTLEIKLKNHSDSVELIVEDNGIGISKHLCTDIFKPFVRVDSSRNSKSGGTGLGLAITKNIIEKHNATIELKSDKDEGCKFTITLKKSTL